MLTDLLKSKHCFKLVCGAGFEDSEIVKKLIYVYALGGCKFFDISANEEILNSAKEALNLAQINDAYICVSIGIKGDPHTNKADINFKKCINCGSCESVCPQGAITYSKVKKSKCIGCERCLNACPKSAISLIAEEKKLDEILPQLIKNKIDCIEFHVDSLEDEEIFAKWNYINQIFNGILSICISRGKFGDEKFLSRIKKMISKRQDYTTIIQADGFPMSGGDDDFKTTLQAIACAEIVQNAKLPVFLMLSGGTNSKTPQLANMCKISYNAVAVGSYARKIVNKYIQRPDFWENKLIQKEAIKIAHKLISVFYNNNININK